MCEFCHSFPHLHGCPNEPEPKAIYTCRCCGEGIVADDQYADIDGEKYHAECLEDMTIYKLLDLFGVSVEVAQEE